MAVDLVINEFMADNATGYVDPAFPTKHPDWIEIYNPTAAAKNLLGWKLKDGSGQAPWTFPSINIPAGGYLVVAADSQNLTNPAAVLHTDFGLSKGGEYLGLLRPDNSVASEFSPAFPNQDTDVSYGIVPSKITTPLISANGVFKAFVPIDDSLGTNWRNEAFDDSGWLPGPSGTNALGGIGFDNDAVPPLAPPGWTVKMVDTSTGSLTNIEQATNILNGNTGGYTVASTTTAAYTDIDFLDGGHFANNRSLPNGFGTANPINAPERTNYALRATSKVFIPQGTYTIGVAADDGFQITIPGVAFTSRIGENNANGTTLSANNQLTWAGTRGGPADTLGTFTVPAGGLNTTIQLDYFNNTNSNMLEVGIASGLQTSWGAGFVQLKDGVLNGAFGSVGARTGGPDPSYQGIFGSDLKNQMQPAGQPASANATAYLRMPFTVTDDNLASITSLVLHMKYDDGFVAWINGTQVAASNAPASPTWNSTATGSRADAQAVIDQDFTITNLAGILHTGTNYLVVQAMNASALDSDFLMVPTLDAVSGLQDAPRFFSVPTPGTANNIAYSGKVADTKFDHDRGFYDAPFNLTITTASSGATIRYTTDGSEPTEINGFVYAGPIPISKTTTLRARAFKNGLLPTNLDTQTYIFVADVITQQASNSNSGPTPGPGWPAATTSGQWIDYGMDPDVVNSAAYGPTIKNDLKTIPTMSIVTDTNNLFGANGLYTNPSGNGITWERPASLELINPDGSKGFQINFGLRIRGGFSRDPSNPKHGLRVLLRSEYGGTELNYPLFKSMNGTDLTRGFDLRTFENYSWSFQNDSRFIGLRDQWSRDTQNDMGYNSERGDMYNLYIDGVYWGIYNTAERPEADYAVSYYGGSTDDYDVVKVDPQSSYTILATDGNLTGWQDFWNQSNALKSAALAGQDTTAMYQKLMGNNPDGTRNPAYPVYLDPKNLIDYNMIAYYGGNLDAPISNFLSNLSPNNFYAIWNHNTKNTGFQYFSHDSEHTLLNVNENRLGPYTAGDTFPKSNPQWIFQDLLYNPDFRQMAADQIHKHMFNGGALTPAVAIARFNKRRDEINRAIVGESARWGDAKTATPYTYVTWENAINTVLQTFFPQRTANMITQFKQQQMGSGAVQFTIYGSLDAPEFANGEQFGGTVAAGYVAHLTNPSGLGTIYYTLDGTDPRMVGSATNLPGALNPAALIYNPATGIPLNASARLLARIRNGTTWSPLTDATFATVTPPPLRITELMYHPQDPPVGSAFLPTDFEYIELQNISASPLNIGKFAFTNGVAFTFPNQMLAAGAKVLVVANIAAFQSRYPGNTTPIAGIFTGNLSNSGERVTLSGALGETIQSFTYSDNWYQQTDGEGFSLVVRDPNQSLALFDGRTGWRSSNALGGDPGADVAALTPDSVVINEIAAKVATPNTTWLELRNTTNSVLDISNWFLSNDPLLPKKYQFPVGTTIPANGYLVLNEQTSYGQALGSPGVLTPFTFDGDGNSTIVLSQADAAGTLLGYREVQDYGATDVGKTNGRYVKTTGGTDFVIQTAASQGAANAGPVIGPAVINEVMYGPVATFNGTKFPNPNLEYIEIRNTTNAPLQLFDPANPANTWRLAGGVTFTLPQNISIPAYAYVVFTNLLPADFRAAYPSFPAAVQVFGPVKGFLNNNGEKLELQRPGVPGALGVVPYIKVDTLSYDSTAPWPTAPNETGPSLIRKSPLEFGNDPINWTATLVNGGNPGKDNLNSVAPLVNGGPDGTSVEGAVWTQNGSFSDPDLGQTYPVSQVTWGDGQSGTLTLNPDKTFTLSHLYKDNGTYTIQIQIIDSGGGTGLDQVVVTVTNLPPTATFAPVGGANVGEGAPKQVSFTNIADPGPNDISGFKYSYDWNNDGTYDVVDSASSSASIPASMLADGPASFTVKGKITDKDGGSTEYTTTVNVVNRLPIVAVIDDQSSPGPFTLNVDGSFIDLGADTWVGSVDWDYHAGDTASVPLALNADKTFTLNHAFNTSGTFVVRVRVTDKDGGVGFKDFNVTVVSGGGDVTPPTVVGSPQFLFASGPRKVTVAFSEDVSQSLHASNLTVNNVDTHADLAAGLMSYAYDANTNTATWTFSSLPDANFHATLHAAGVTDAASNPLAQDAGVDFWFLNGDTDRDRSVGFTDLVSVAQHYDSPTGTFATGDVDGDGTVGFPDLVVVAQQYGKQLALPAPSDPAPAAAVASAPVTAPALSAAAPATVVAPPPTPPAAKAAVGTPPTAFAAKKAVAAKPVVVRKPKAPQVQGEPANPFSVTRIATTPKKRNDLFA